MREFVVVVVCVYVCVCARACVRVCVRALACVHEIDDLLLCLCMQGHIHPRTVQDCTYSEHRLDRQFWNDVSNPAGSCQVSAI